MMTLQDEENVAQQLMKLLDQLSTNWMIQGSAALTEFALSELALLAERDIRCSAFLLRVRELLEECRQGICDWTANPITQMHALLPTNFSRVQEPKIEPTATMLTFDEDPEMLAGFVMEAEEHLNAIEEQILALEKDPSLLSNVHAVFRGFHTIKGLAGFLALTRVQSVAHEVETLLDHARNNRVCISTEIVDLVLDSGEYLRHETARVQAKLNGKEVLPVIDNGRLLERIASITQEALSRGQTVTTGATEVVNSATPKAESTDATVALSIQPVNISARESVVQTAGESVADKVAPRAEITSGSIRIETSKLDRLMDLVGEMVTAQAILKNNPVIMGKLGARLAGDLSQLARITAEVQKRAMSMRMMSIGPLFQKNAKLVRDLSRRHGKQVELELVGESTELDKAIAEELSDPLLHMIRNSLDHGIETPEQRIEAGKSPTAHLRLSAEHRAGQIVIAISDDGRGLDPERILRKAKQNGLVEDGAQLSQSDIFRLIFAPGFSTAEKITDISGRGVGMDVVRKHVETLRGKIQIHSELGKGTTFFIHLPLTLAIIDGLVIVVGSYRYIVPIFSIREMFRPSAEMVSTVQGREEMILIRGNLLPLVRLHKRFGITPRTEDICRGVVVVCELASKQYCLFVDDLLGRQEVVIKNLGETFRDISGLSGCAILGDGQIGLILDVNGIYHMPNAGTKAEAVA